MPVRRGIDTNVLVYAHLGSLPEHPAVHRFLQAQLRDSEVVLALTPGILHELIHVVTDGRRFESPLSMLEATNLARNYLQRTNVDCLETDSLATQRALDLLTMHRLGRKRIADTLFAATLLRHGVRELITCNGDDFALFPELQVIDPRRFG